MSTLLPRDDLDASWESQYRIALIICLTIVLSFILIVPTFFLVRLALRRRAADAKITRWGSGSGKAGFSVRRVMTFGWDPQPLSMRTKTDLEKIDTGYAGPQRPDAAHVVGKEKGVGEGVSEKKEDEDEAPSGLWQSIAAKRQG